MESIKRAEKSVKIGAYFEKGREDGEKGNVTLTAHELDKLMSSGDDPLLDKRNKEAMYLQGYEEGTRNRMSKVEGDNIEKVAPDSNLKPENIFGFMRVLVEFCHLFLVPFNSEIPMKERILCALLLILLLIPVIVMLL